MIGWIKAAGRRLRQGVVGAGVLAIAGCGGVSLPVGGGGQGGSINPDKPVAVALLIPSGSADAGDQVIATSLENAARLAVADLEGAEVDLRVYGTAGDPNQAAAVAAQAVSEGAKVIIGPLRSAAANAVGAVVAPQGVNVLAFSNNTDIAGGNIFLLGNTFENSANRMVRYAVGQGKDQILIVNGQSLAEQKGRSAIAAAITRHGATQVGAEGFELSLNGVVQAAPRIAAAARNAGAEAVFFTSGTAGALREITQFVKENGLDPAATQFIGLQRWDVPAAALELGPLQGGWFAVPSPGLAQQFRSRYEAAYGEPPHALAGLAYDGIAAVGALIQQGNRDALTVAQLTQGTGFSGVNGIFRLRPDGKNERGLAVATIRENQLVVLDPAPRSFGGAGF
jgi:hypothetical protein